MKSMSILCFLVISVLANAENASNRIISAGGSITEIMYALGLQEQIIAVDSSSYFPAEVRNKPQVGYFRRLSAEGVLSTRPTRVVASNGAGPDEALQQIKAAGVEVNIFTQEVYTLDAWKDYLREIGGYFGKQTEANGIINRVEARLRQLTDDQDEAVKTAIFLIDVGDRGPVAAGYDTVPDMLFNLAGLDNIVNEFDGFKPYSAEQLLRAQPDLIVMPSYVVAKMGGTERICGIQVIAMSTAKNGCQLLVMDSLLSLGYGTRIDEAVEVLLNHE
jgi:iron complex transport system substrate-binding protein